MDYWGFYTTLTYIKFFYDTRVLSRTTLQVEEPFHSSGRNPNSPPFVAVILSSFTWFTRESLQSLTHNSGQKHVKYKFHFCLSSISRGNFIAGSSHGEEVCSAKIYLPFDHINLKAMIPVSVHVRIIFRRVVRLRYASTPKSTRGRFPSNLSR